MVSSMQKILMKMQFEPTLLDKLKVMKGTIRLSKVKAEYYESLEKAQMFKKYKAQKNIS